LVRPCPCAHGSAPSSSFSVGFVSVPSYLPKARNACALPAPCHLSIPAPKACLAIMPILASSPCPSLSAAPYLQRGSSPPHPQHSCVHASPLNPHRCIHTSARPVSRLSFRHRHMSPAACWSLHHRHLVNHVHLGNTSYQLIVCANAFYGRCSTMLSAFDHAICPPVSSSHHTTTNHDQPCDLPICIYCRANMP
jgi:hypothetical protein